MARVSLTTGNLNAVPAAFKAGSSRPQSQGNLEFRNPMSGRHWRRASVEKPDLVSKVRTAPMGYQPIRLVGRPRAPNLRFLVFRQMA